MKTIKNVLFIALLMTGTTVFAQHHPGSGLQKPGEPSMKQGGAMIEELNLSAEQKTKLKDIRKDYRQKDSIAFAEFCKQKEQGQIERMNAFKSVLNKEQLGKFEKLQLIRSEKEIFNHPNKSGRMGMKPGESCPMKNGQPQGFGKQHRNNIGQGRFAKMNQPGMDRRHRYPQQRPMVQLSPEQRAQKQTQWLTKVLDLNEKQSARIQEINLKYTQKDSVKTGDRKILKEKIAAKQKEIKLVLNKEQNEKYDELLKKGKEIRLQGSGHSKSSQPAR